MTDNEYQTDDPIPMPSEARYICWFNMFGHKADTNKVEREIQMNITIRGFENSAAFAEDIKNTVANLRAELNLELYSTIRKPDPAGLPVPGTEHPKAPSDKAPPPGARSQTEQATAGGNGKTGGAEQITAIKVVPEPEDRVTIELLRTGMRYPVLKIAKWPIDRVLELLPPGWMYDHLKVAEIYDVQWSATWVQGKATTKGGFYKDITAITDQSTQ